MKLMQELLQESESSSKCVLTDLVKRAKIIVLGA